jgi:hypothetical protein
MFVARARRDFWPGESSCSDLGVVSEVTESFEEVATSTGGCEEFLTGLARSGRGFSGAARSREWVMMRRDFRVEAGPFSAAPVTDIANVDPAADGSGKASRGTVVGARADRGAERCLRVSPSERRFSDD